jgi:hypothetical protein
LVPPVPAHRDNSDTSMNYHDSEHEAAQSVPLRFIDGLMSLRMGQKPGSYIASRQSFHMRHVTETGRLRIIEACGFTLSAGTRPVTISESSQSTVTTVYAMSLYRTSEAGF